MNCVETNDNIDCVQRLMIPGSQNAGCLEQTADGCLSFPAAMWRGRYVEIKMGGILRRSRKKMPRGWGTL